MTGSSPSSPRAKEIFAELLARHEGGETIDWEVELARSPDVAAELRALHARWKEVEALLGGLVVDDASLESAAQEARAHATLDDDTARRIASIARPDRGAVRYRELERIGMGGMGVVTRVRDVDLERELALKTIRGKGASGSSLRRFLQEARIAARLQHPGILPVHDVGIDATGRVYFTMPLVRGASLADVLELARAGRDGWNVARVLEVILKVCDALAFAHAQGVVHRDLKPANVLVGGFGEVYVTDWGLARLVAEHEEGDEAIDEVDDDAEALADDEHRPATAHGAVLGTASYMAPEQARGEVDHIGPRTDVYAIGAILYHLLTGAMPYAGTSEREALEAVRRGPPIPVERSAPGTPEELLSICAKAMARIPVDRYRGCDELAADLRAYMEGRVVHAFERGAWPELRKWFARNRAIALPISVAMLVALVALGALIWKDASARSEIVRLSDAQRLVELEARASELWPAVPSRVPALQRWIADGHALIRRLPIHEAALRELRERALPPTPERRFAFADAEDQWRHDALARLVEGLQRLQARAPGISVQYDVERRLRFALEVEQRSFVDARAAWDEARNAIARLPFYDGLVLRPQLGLVPIGADPASGLWEFAHLASGEPARRLADGTIDARREHGVVLVLVPGGRFRMGSLLDSRRDAKGEFQPEADPLARNDETPRIELELGPFFLSKYEMTQAQWWNVAYSSPSAHAGGSPVPNPSSVLPVETIAWQDAERVLAHAALVLPTEAQWEYAARAGTTTRFWCGNAVASLSGRVQAGWGDAGRSFHLAEEWETLPVERGGANAWGFVHVAGNVAEWVADLYEPSLAGARRSGDGGLIHGGSGARVVRGGSFASSPSDLRSAARRAFSADARSPELGVRPARALDR